MPVTFAVLLWVIGGVALLLWLFVDLSDAEMILALFGTPIASFAIGAALHHDLFGSVFGDLGRLLTMIGIVFCAISTGGMTQAKIREGIKYGSRDFSLWHGFVTILGIVGDIVGIASFYR